MRHLQFNETPISGLYLIKRTPIGDSRGMFERMFCQNALEPLLDGRTVKQINHTVTKNQGVIRGLHFQFHPYSECKIVSCIKGKVWDVALDLRKGSPTFMMHFSVVLSDENFCSLYIPEGIAHGFQTQTVDCEMLYFHTASHNPNSEGGVNALDPLLGIKWPLKVSGRSDRDANHPMMAESFLGI